MIVTFFVITPISIKIERLWENKYPRMMDIRGDFLRLNPIPLNIELYTRHRF